MVRSEAHLSKDSKVEVCSNEEGYKNAWFPAKILNPQPLNPSTKKKMNKPLVQYENLASDDDPNKLLTELVDASSIRPVPPPDNPDQSTEVLPLRKYSPRLQSKELCISFNCHQPSPSLQIVSST
ncbi:hypothetical protein CerSpe_157980 [Prunus speciosa]